MRIEEPEFRPVYVTGMKDNDDADSAERLRAYLMGRRRALITELRNIEKLLGLDQSIPERRRPH
ncbi:MAG: hypothetical protein LC131_02890 [Anaerolineae bacterium]|nr:hypothetical protein [Anaerolineae bacterium]